MLKFPFAWGEAVCFYSRLSTFSQCRIGVLRWCVCSGGDVRALAAGDREFTISFFCKEYQLDFLLAQQKGPTVVSLWDGIVFGRRCRNLEKKMKSPSRTA